MKPPSIAVFALLLTVCSGYAGTELLYEEDFELPDVPAYAEGTVPVGWVKANQGFGSGRHGLTDESSGDFISPDPTNNHQAITFRYTNSGCTTGEGEIGQLVLETTYTVTFDAATDFGRPGVDTAYDVQFMVMTNGTPRNDRRSTPPGAFVLASRSGNAPSDGSYTNLTITYTPHLTNDVGKVGMDLTIRLKGVTGSCCIDNVRFYWVAPPPKGTVLRVK